MKGTTDPLRRKIERRAEHEKGARKGKRDEVRASTVGKGKGDTKISQRRAI